MNRMVIVSNVQNNHNICYQCVPSQLHMSVFVESNKAVTLVLSIVVWMSESSVICVLTFYLPLEVIEFVFLIFSSPHAILCCPHAHSFKAAPLIKDKY